MTNMYHTPCELILKVGSNECEDLSTAVTSLLRTCSISDQAFFVLERQIQPTTYLGSFTHPSSTSVPIPSQSLSCVLLLTDDILKQQQLVRPLSSSSSSATSIATKNRNNNNVLLPKSKHFFKSTHTWNFHHKIELLDENKQAIARQDYYELSHSLPLWSVSHIPHSRQPIVRFNIFTQHYDTLLTFYIRLFQRQPDSSKAGFALFILPSSPQVKIIYQFSIKYSPSIQPYSIAQSAYLKFRLNHLDHFLTEYNSKIFTLNKFEYYIYDPDGNLLHLHLYNHPKHAATKEEHHLCKAIPHPIDSGIGGDSSDPTTSKHLFSTTVPQGYKPFYPGHNIQSNNHRIPADIDVESHSSQSSHDSGRWSSISSNDLNMINRTKRAIQRFPTNITNSSSRSTITTKNSDRHLEEAMQNCRLKQQQQQQQQQQRGVHSRNCTRRNEQSKSSLYDSEPRLANFTSVTNRYYSSMSDVQTGHTNRLSMSNSNPSNKPKIVQQLHSINDYECDISYEVDSPRQQSTDSTCTSYLDAFLMKKRQEEQAIRSANVQQLIAQFDHTKPSPMLRRPLSAPLVDQSIKPTKGILQRRPTSSLTPITNKSSRKRSKSVTFDCHSDEEEDGDEGHLTSSTDDDRIRQQLKHRRSPRINIGITLDSRLRKTPALEMLRSTMMEPDLGIQPVQIDRTTSVRQPCLPVARF